MTRMWVVLFGALLVSALPLLVARAEAESPPEQDEGLPERKDLTPVALWQYIRQQWDLAYRSHDIDLRAAWSQGGWGTAFCGGPVSMALQPNPDESKKQAEEAVRRLTRQGLTASALFEARSNELKANERPLLRNLRLIMEPTCSFTWAMSVMQALNDPLRDTWQLPREAHGSNLMVSRNPVESEEIDNDLHQLLHLEDQVRLDGVKGLGRKKADEAIDALTCMVTDDPCPAVREAAARSLALIGTRSRQAQTALFALERAAREDNDSRVRHAAEFAAEIIQLAEE
jgi:hypothetical protein